MMYHSYVSWVGMSDNTYTHRLCLVPEKFEGKCEGKKIQRKSRRKEKVKENKK